MSSIKKSKSVVAGLAFAIVSIVGINTWYQHQSAQLDPQVAEDQLLAICADFPKCKIKFFDLPWLDGAVS